VKNAAIAADSHHARLWSRAVNIYDEYRQAWCNQRAGGNMQGVLAAHLEISANGSDTEVDGDVRSGNKKMPETFAQYLDKWLKQSTAQGLNNPLVKMPVKRFRLLQPPEFNSIANGGALAIGTMSEPIARNLYKNFQTRIRERGEHCAFICYGSIEMTIAGGVGQQPRSALFPVCLKRSSLQTNGDQIKATVSEDEGWQFNPALEAHLRGFGVKVPATLAHNPDQATNWVKAQLGNQASQVKSDGYVGLFSSQQMVLQGRLTEPPLRQALARNPIVQSKIEGIKVRTVDLGEITDEGLEELGLVLPCDDSQLRVVQLSDLGCCLQVEGPPGTGKSQTIANIVSNALYHDRNVLLVCDKKAAIVQVEERLSNCGLAPALLNLHDEDLDKREFLKRATEKFPSGIFASRTYPFDQLRDIRKTLNDRVRFSRTIAHSSLQVTKRDALAGLIQLRKELKNVPNIQIANWQSLSKERLSKLLGCLAQWPDLVGILTDAENVWNEVCVENFDDNPNAANELGSLVQKILTQLECLDTVREQAASVGIELPVRSDAEVADVLTLVGTVLARPACHPKLVGNHQITLAELEELKNQWERREKLVSMQHPVPLTEVYSEETERETKVLLANEMASTWKELSQREAYHTARHAEVEASQKNYQRLCDQMGLVYSSLLKVRRAQLQAVLSLGEVGASIPRSWWISSATPVLSVAGWKAHLQACVGQAKSAPLPLNFIALEHIAETHWQHVEAKAEHGFNLVSYCLHFVHDRKCKLALRQVFPAIPSRRFKHWQEVTLHAISTLRAVNSLRSVSETHFVLKQLTSGYLAVSDDNTDSGETYLCHEQVQKLEKAAVLVEQLRARNDLCEVNSPHWQTLWESQNPSLFTKVKNLLSELDTLSMPENQTDNVEEALKFYDQSRHRIQQFLENYQRLEGNVNQSVMAAFAAQKEFARCQNSLVPLAKYLELQSEPQQKPDWNWLQSIISWRDLFERLRGQQKLDVDSPLWLKLRESLNKHQVNMATAYEALQALFEGYREDLGEEKSLLWPFNSLPDYETLSAVVAEIVNDLPRHPLWLEKKRWRAKIPAFPEIRELWSKIVEGTVRPEHAQRLFCFNLLRLCDPVAKPHGPELKQTLNAFDAQDEKLASWVIDHMKAKLREAVSRAAATAAHSESELRRLSSLQRVRGTVRELVNAHLDYLLDAKPCWMMSPTSLANLIDSRIFVDHGVPFDLVIFDEASQIRVLDGLLSMSFGKQVIIVGDKNQLPPTDFFAGFATVDQESDSIDFGISESLLEEFAGVFDSDQTQVMLMSHYRSETPDLIRFSNDWFYDNKLEMYPPAHVAGIGRQFHYVPNAIYSERAGQRNNPAEADEVVKLIELHVRECPDKSLGVVTMNIPQMELIDEKLQFFTAEEVRAFCADESKFFLRNLETVQGDEMDRIILSLTYGKNNPSAPFNANVLGPLTRSGGERRLNVAITRSRNGLIVVSSLKAADLEASGAQSKGFQCLKALLLDLENTEQVRTFGIGNKRFTKRRDGISNVVYCDSPFEAQVVEFLENEGYEVECQYGAGKFWIDIVVKERGRNILAIECDGAGYHSSLVARTRDRARQRVLETLGWRIHRVWSTNWWYFEQQEKEAIIGAINAARKLKPLPVNDRSRPFTILTKDKKAPAESSTDSPTKHEQTHNHSDSKVEQERRITSQTFPTAKSESPEPEQPRSSNQTQRFLETGRTRGTRVIKELCTLNQRFKNPQCSGCGGKANLTINNEGLVIICANSGCKKKTERIDTETLQRLVDRLFAPCHNCKKPGLLKSVARSWGNILICQNLPCGANNSWQGISDKIDQRGV
jgi:very-short-patch-repair endonuclease